MEEKGWQGERKPAPEDIFLSVTVHWGTALLLGNGILGEKPHPEFFLPPFCCTLIGNREMFLWLCCWIWSPCSYSDIRTSLMLINAMTQWINTVLGKAVNYTQRKQKNKGNQTREKWQPVLGFPLSIPPKQPVLIQSRGKPTSGTSSWEPLGVQV